MPFRIRPATPEDSEIVSKLMLQAMKEIVFSLIATTDVEEALLFLTSQFKQKANLYSFENTFVAEDEKNNVLGSITGYDGDDFLALRKPILEVIKNKYNNSFVPEKETDGEEYYLDTVAVSAFAQGKGIGSKLIVHAANYAQAKGFKQLGLLVDLKNPNAQRLYTRLGFKLGKKRPLTGGEYYHMYMKW